LKAVDTDEDAADPFGGMKLKMEYLEKTSKCGAFIHQWFPKATRNKHSSLGNMIVKNVWLVERDGDAKKFSDAQQKIGKINTKEKPFHQPSDRPDLNPNQNDLYSNTNTGLLFHGTRSVNVTGLLREGFRFPKELSGVLITGAMFTGAGGGVYFADDIKKSAGYTSLRGSYYSGGSGAVKGRDAFMFICDVALGVPHVATKPHPYTSYPSGTNCIFGKAEVSQVQNNEWIILNKNQYKFNYLVEFTTM
jgi:hypothetical protein